ncbi:MAG TPA: hypothetical protein O0X39_04360 [Methanocorpusculum sp.]|nr:hypothetical protein [Methanocorpusculum sp.]
MSKYNPVWEYVGASGKEEVVLSFAEIERICGFAIDHSFLNAKKELAAFEYVVKKISMKEKAVLFEKSAGK